MRSESPEGNHAGRAGRTPPPMMSSVRVPDYWRIDLTQAWQVRFWTREFGVSEARLREALREAGDNVGDVRAHLAGQ
jgi:hypothetical protein